MQVIDGRGELLTFGGQVMKNVAGYDVARLMCGSLGTLAVLAEVSPEGVATAGRGGEPALRDGSGDGLAAPQ